MCILIMSYIPQSRNSITIRMCVIRTPKKTRTFYSVQWVPLVARYVCISLFSPQSPLSLLSSPSPFVRIQNQIAATNPDSDPGDDDADNTCCRTSDDFPHVIPLGFLFLFSFYFERMHPSVAVEEGKSEDTRWWSFPQAFTN